MQGGIDILHGDALVKGNLVLRLISRFGHDGDFDLGGHTGAEFDPDRKFAERFDRFIQEDVPLVDLDPLGDERLFDILHTHRSVRVSPALRLAGR